MSNLNPYAESYIPLARREVKDEDQGCKTLPCEDSDWHPPVGDLKLKHQQPDGHFDSPFQNPDQMEGKFSDEQSEMDMAYLQMIFPGVSEQSLIDVYNVNKGDLDAAMDMLTHLESEHNIPDAYNVEDSQTPSSFGECSSKKDLDATSKSISSSVSPDSTVAT